MSIMQMLLQDLAGKDGISEEAIVRAMGSVDRRSRRTGAANDGRGIKGSRQEGNGIAEKEARGSQKASFALGGQK